MSQNNKITFRTIWSVFMAIVYFVMGYFVLFTGVLLKYNFDDNNSEDDNFLIVRYVLGIGLFAYGFFRIYRVLKNKK